MQYFHDKNINLYFSRTGRNTLVCFKNVFIVLLKHIGFSLKNIIVSIVSQMILQQAMWFSGAGWGKKELISSYSLQDGMKGGQRGDLEGKFGFDAVIECCLLVADILCLLLKTTQDHLTRGGMFTVSRDHPPMSRKKKVPCRL